MNWKNVFVAGGSVLACLLPIPDSFDKTEVEDSEYTEQSAKRLKAVAAMSGEEKMKAWFHETAFPTSDIDIFLYGLPNKEAAKIKALQIYESLERSLPPATKLHAFRTPHTLTLIFSFPYRCVCVYFIVFIFVSFYFCFLNKRCVQINLGLYRTKAEVLANFDMDCVTGTQ